MVGALLVLLSRCMTSGSEDVRPDTDELRMRLRLEASIAHSW